MQCYYITEGLCDTHAVALRKTTVQWLSPPSILPVQALHQEQQLACTLLLTMLLLMHFDKPLVVWGPRHKLHILLLNARYRDKGMK